MMIGTFSLLYLVVGFMVAVALEAWFFEPRRYSHHDPDTDILVIACLFWPVAVIYVSVCGLFLLLGKSIVRLAEGLAA